jgi:hypothetical protein
MMPIRETLYELPSAKPPFGVLRTHSKDKFAAVHVSEECMTNLTTECRGVCSTRVTTQ